MWTYSREGSAIASVPATISSKPIKPRFDNRSPKNSLEKITVMRMLSLSMGTTTLTMPF